RLGDFGQIGWAVFCGRARSDHQRCCAGRAVDEAVHSKCDCCRLCSSAQDRLCYTVIDDSPPVSSGLADTFLLVFVIPNRHADEPGGRVAVRGGQATEPRRRALPCPAQHPLTEAASTAGETLRSTTACVADQVAEVRAPPSLHLGRYIRARRAAEHP